MAPLLCLGATKGLRVINSVVLCVLKSNLFYGDIVPLQLLVITKHHENVISNNINQ